MDINKWLEEYKIISGNIEELPCGSWDCIISKQEYLNKIEKIENNLHSQLPPLKYCDWFVVNKHYITRGNWLTIINNNKCKKGWCDINDIIIDEIFSGQILGEITVNTKAIEDKINLENLKKDYPMFSDIEEVIKKVKYNVMI